MQKSWNQEKQHFGQSFEDTDVLDSSVLIMPLVFFMHAVCPHCLFRVLPYSILPQSDPRFLSTLKQVLKTPERGGLTSNVSLPLLHFILLSLPPLVESCLPLRC